MFYGLCLLAVIAIFFKIRRCAPSPEMLSVGRQMLLMHPRLNCHAYGRWDTLNFLLGIGLACEVVGYIFRILSNRVDPYR